MIVDSSNYRMSIPNSSKNEVVSDKPLRYSDTANATNSPSATDLEAQEAEEDLLVAQKSHLEYLSGTGRPFEEFLAELRSEEGSGEVSN